MSQIMVSPDQIRQLSGQFQQASQDSQNILGGLQNAVNNMQGEWEGAAQQQFFQEFEQWKASMTQFTQLLDNIVQGLNEYAARLDAANTGG